MRFAYAKIGTGNSEIDEYLLHNGDTFIPIYFDCSYTEREDFLERGKAKEQGKLFFEFGDSPTEKCVVVAARGLFHLFKPTGSVIFRNKKNVDGSDRWVKLLPVSLISSWPVSAVPAVLAGINANRYYSSGTFREIKSLGNVEALKYLLGAKNPTSCKRTLAETLSLLGSVELETLIARILDEHNLFVPAHHGGTMQDADLFAHNDTAETIKVSNLIVPGKSSISIQVKLTSPFTVKPSGIDYVICANGESHPWQFNSIWIDESLLVSPNARAWLMRSIQWAEPEFLQPLTSAP